MRRSSVSRHRTARKKGFVLPDPTLTTLGSRGRATLRNMNLFPTKASKGFSSKFADNSKYNATPNQHAFPLLNHTDFGGNDQAAITKYIDLANYMPKRGKGRAPWFRGANTYSPAYAEQGRFEYMRYTMIARFPQDYLKNFRESIQDMRRAAQNKDGMVIMHSLLSLIVDNFNPQHVHYQTAMETLLQLNELGYARDVWRVMERQMTWPDDKCIVAYLAVCLKAKNKAWAFECWNRYCTEKRFLEPNEADPKPIARVPFSLDRDELLHLPKWKKFFDHDPNLDVADRNRFNITRSIYKAMARVMFATGDIALFEKFFSDLEHGLLTTPSPVPEPPEVAIIETPQWQPRWEEDRVTSANPWAADNETAKNSLGPTTTRINELSERYLTNDQFYIRLASELIEDAVANDALQAEQRAAFVDEIIERVFNKIGAKIGDLLTDVFFARIIAAESSLRSATGAQCIQKMKELASRKAAAAGLDTVEVSHEFVYLQVLRGFNAQIAREAGAATFQPRDIVREVTLLIQEMASRVSFEWAADHHFEIVKLLVRTGTMAANEYFVKNVLRKFRWDSRFCEELYLEYKRHPDVELWAELTKRMLVWTARYNVDVSESVKRLIEDDYAYIKVQVRSLRELVIFAFRHAEETRLAQQPAALLPNPVMDYVSHALPFPDRDTGTLDEYGEVGQMRAPERGIRAPRLWSPAVEDEGIQKGITATWKDTTATVNTVKLPAPWDAKYKEYNRGKHPSYDQIYAGPFPEIFPARQNFRKQTRWDFREVESQSKYKFGNPY